MVGGKKLSNTSNELSLSDILAINAINSITDETLESIVSKLIPKERLQEVTFYVTRNIERPNYETYLEKLIRWFIKKVRTLRLKL